MTNWEAKKPLPRAMSREGPEFGADKPWLAPLAGYSDLPFRMLCREYGAAVCVTEMISAKGLFYHSCRTGKLLANTAQDSPLVVQLFGAESGFMGEAVKLLRKCGYRWFDCNMGCSVRKVARQGAGAALLGNPDKALEVARAMLAAAAASDGDKAKVGFKLRTGINPENTCLPDLALRLEDAGAAWLAVHPRYASQGFTGEADWNVLAQLASRLSIPLLASGDLTSAEKGLLCIAQTGVSGVMYARGALRNPAIFRDHLALLAESRKPDFTRADLLHMVRRHINLSQKLGEEKGAFLKMRSLAPRYARDLAGIGEFRRAVCSCSDWDEFSQTVEKFLNLPINFKREPTTEMGNDE